MPRYRPADPGPVTFSAGTWVSPGQPDRTVMIAFDPLLLTWHVTQASRRSSRTYQVKLGRPATTITLV
jgi:hypothetical protein